MSTPLSLAQATTLPILGHIPDVQKLDAKTQIIIKTPGPAAGRQNTDNHKDAQKFNAKNPEILNVESRRKSTESNKEASKQDAEAQKTKETPRDWTP